MRFFHSFGIDSIWNLSPRNYENVSGCFFVHGHLMLRSVTPCCATEICKSVSEGHTHWQNTRKLKVVRFAYFLPDRIFIFVSSLKSQPLQQVTFPILTALLYGIVTNWIPTKLMFSRLWSAVRCSSDYCNVLVYLSWYKLETHSPRN